MHSSGAVLNPCVVPPSWALQIQRWFSTKGMQSSHGHVRTAIKRLCFSIRNTSCSRKNQKHLHRQTNSCQNRARPQPIPTQLTVIQCLVFNLHLKFATRSPLVRVSYMNTKLFFWTDKLLNCLREPYGPTPQQFQQFWATSSWTIQGVNWVTEHRVPATLRHINILELTLPAYQCWIPTYAFQKSSDCPSPS
jgi:hypothetical protein